MASSVCKGMVSLTEHIVIPDKTGILFMRKKGKAEGCLYNICLLSAAGHCSEHFTCHNSLEPHNNLAMWVLIIILQEMDTCHTASKWPGWLAVSLRIGGDTKKGLVNRSSLEDGGEDVRRGSEKI